jgi:hypothetical protein
MAYLEFDDSLEFISLFAPMHSRRFYYWPDWQAFTNASYVDGELRRAIFAVSAQSECKALYLAQQICIGIEAKLAAEDSIDGDSEIAEDE